MSAQPSLWLRWKSLRLPWRRHILVGSDLSGNTFWEYFPRGVSRSVRPRRILRPSKKTHHSDVRVSPSWHQWLKQTRADAPSIQEQMMDVRRLQELQVNARLADARWEAKGRYIEKPKEETSQVNATGTGEEAGQHIGKTTADAQSKPQSVTDRTGHNPGANWQPEAWSPGPKRA